MNTTPLHPALVAALEEVAREREALVEEIRLLRERDAAPPSDEGEDA